MNAIRAFCLTLCALYVGVFVATADGLPFDRADGFIAGVAAFTGLAALAPWKDD